MNAPSATIDEAIIGAILAGRLSPGTRLGEQQVALLFGVSRTRVREAMMRLGTRGIVRVAARRGWFVVEPSADEAREAFEARRVIESGMLLAARAVPPGAFAELARHLEVERQAILGGDVGGRACLLGDFHIHLARFLGNRLLTEIVRDLTARTTLISMLYQPTDKADESSHDHERIVAALEAGDFARAARLMGEHLDHVEAGLDLELPPDPLALLRDLLTPAALATRAGSLPPSAKGPQA
jgi:DNA-binding GntR family transcriptional regulator